MPNTFASPSDPVTNGASLIQSTNFIPVSGDYEQSDMDAVSTVFRTQRGATLDAFPSTPKKGHKWTFHQRTDLAAASAYFADLLALQTYTSSVVCQVTAADGTESTSTQAVGVVVSHSWTPKTKTDSNGNVTLYWLHKTVQETVELDTATKAFNLPVTGYRDLYTLVNRLWVPVAAGAPVSTGLSNALAGKNSF